MDYGLLLLGLFIGFLIGESLEEKKVKLTGTILFALVSLLGYLETLSLSNLNFLSYGLTLGLLLSIIFEPGPIGWCIYKCTKK